MEVIWDNREAVALGFVYTVLLFLFAGIGSMIWGTALAAMRVGPVPVLRWASTLYVTLVRNTPLLLVLLFFRFAAPKADIRFDFIDVVIPTSVGDVRLNNLFSACTIGLIVYTSAFVCEAMRSGINAVPLGQAEAARAIGLPFSGVMNQVILPQALRAAVPPLTSVQIAMLKNTTVAGVFGVAEAFAQMRILINDHTSARTGLFIGFAIIFVVLVEIIAYVGARFERKWRVA